MKWYWWYVLAVTALTLVTFADELAGWSALIFVIPFNIALYFIPVWLVVKLVQWIRKPRPT
jgi:hypothetical protein